MSFGNASRWHATGQGTDSGHTLGTSTFIASHPPFNIPRRLGILLTFMSSEDIIVLRSSVATAVVDYLPGLLVNLFN